jgi:NAD-dependent DNA ligase/DNA polymerase/3'-5' exonuclease PolX
MNEKLAKTMSKMADIMNRNGEPMRSKAYKKAEETILTIPYEIKSINDVKGKPGIGESMLHKVKEYLETGKLACIEGEENKPEIILTNVYGIGPQKAKELVKNGITDIKTLIEKQNDVLNDVQKKGLKYYDDILKQIPRMEIDEYNKIFKKTFEKIATNKSQYEIVGSYRRGLSSSGDIDVIITSNPERIGSQNIFENFINSLISQKIIVEILSRGKNKCLVISKIPKSDTYRRTDFLYSTIEEYPFSILYFTGSKGFNTVMRGHALQQGYSLNEHGLSNSKDGIKGQLIDQPFTDEKSIFDFLKLEYKTPIERVDGRSVVPITQNIVIPINNEDIQKMTEFKTHGISVLEKMNENTLIKLVQTANHEYYNENNTILSDNEYDIIKEYISNRFPKNAILEEIGAPPPIQSKNKITLPYEMPSMDKIKPDSGSLKNWVEKYKGPYVLSCKLDGVSAMYICDKSNTYKLYTRGNGHIGQDISHLINILKLPKIQKNMAIRGELIISKSIFKTKYMEEFANARNLVSGIVNRKITDEKTTDLHFVTYEIIEPQMKPREQMELLQKIGLEVVFNKIENTITNELLSDILIDWRKNYEYEIDGIIVSNNAIYPREHGNPEHSFAFKMVMSDQVAEAKVIDVLWEASKDGYLKPRVRIEPIQLAGVRIEYATGFNGKFIEDNKIGIGSIIVMVRSGDVIPYIKSVTTQSEKAKMPTVSYIWNKTHVDILLENPNDDIMVQEKNVALFFVSLEVEGLAKGNIKKLFAIGKTSVPKILKMNIADFEMVEGFKRKMSEKIFHSIKDKVEKATLIDIIIASGKMGRGLGERKIQLILSKYPAILTSNESNETKEEMLRQVDGIGKENAHEFVKNIPNFISFLKECQLEYKLENITLNINNVTSNNVTVNNMTPISNNTHALFGKKIVMTKVRDAEIIEFMKKNGIIMENTMKKDVFVLIVASNKVASNKTIFAEKNGIPIMTVDEFKLAYM